ncbi:MAG: TraR/DksA family transcriptional regulator [Sphingobacteriia bacterium]|nr:TraR/DksA family transcriptional regulator [Sphingobacteriia bacterium]
MATKKPAPKKAAPAKKAIKPAPKKAAPAKKVAAKPAAKKTAPAKPAPKKGVPAKVAPKKAAPAKAIAKPVAKPAAKKTAPAKPAPKPAAKPVAKAVVKPVAKPAAKPVGKPAAKPAAPAKAVAKPVAKPVAAAPAKPTPPPVPLKPAVKAPPAPPVKPVKKDPGPIKDVKVPKINVKTSVPYNPGYTPLEKRVEAAKPQGPLVKYNDADLAEFRDLINKKLEAAKKELAYLQGLITRKDEMGGDNDDSRYMTMEDGTMSMEKEQLSQMASRQITYIDHLEKALMRIENKTYGICRVTGKLIDKARLRAVPHATLSLEAKLGLVKPSAE